MKRKEHRLWRWNSWDLGLDSGMWRRMSWFEGTGDDETKNEDLLADG